MVAPLSLQPVPQPPRYVHLQRSRYVGRSHVAVHPDAVQECGCQPAQLGGAGCNPETCLNATLRIECTPGYCACGGRCGNQRMQRSQNAPTKLVHMGSKGWGLLAATNIAEDSLILEYAGEVVGVVEAQRRALEYARRGVRHTYIMILQGDEVIDATETGSRARFMNHSCAPNCEMQKWQVLGELCVGIFAKRDIAAGEELCYSYNLEWNGGRRVRCQCGAAECVGYLGGHAKAFQEALAAEAAAAAALETYDDTDGGGSSIDTLSDFGSDDETSQPGRQAAAAVALPAPLAVPLALQNGGHSRQQQLDSAAAARSPCAAPSSQAGHQQQPQCQQQVRHLQPPQPAQQPGEGSRQRGKRKRIPLPAAAASAAGALPAGDAVSAQRYQRKGKRLRPAAVQPAAADPLDLFDDSDTEAAPAAQTAKPAAGSTAHAACGGGAGANLPAAARPAAGAAAAPRPSPVPATAAAAPPGAAAGSVAVAGAAPQPAAASAAAAAEMPPRVVAAAATAAAAGTQLMATLTMQQGSPAASSSSEQLLSDMPLSAGVRATTSAVEAAVEPAAKPACTARNQAQRPAATTEQAVAAWQAPGRQVAATQAAWVDMAARPATVPLLDAKLVAALAKLPQLAALTAETSDTATKAAAAAPVPPHPAPQSCALVGQETRAQAQAQAATAAQTTAPTASVIATAATLTAQSQPPAEQALSAAAQQPPAAASLPVVAAAPTAHVRRQLPPAIQAGLAANAAADQRQSAQQQHPQPRSAAATPSDVLALPITPGAVPAAQEILPRPAAPEPLLQPAAHVGPAPAHQKQPDGLLALRLHPATPQMRAAVASAQHVVQPHDRLAMLPHGNFTAGQAHERQCEPWQPQQPACRQPQQPQQQHVLPMEPHAIAGWHVQQQQRHQQGQWAPQRRQQQHRPQPQQQLVPKPKRPGPVVAAPHQQPPAVQHHHQHKQRQQQRDSMQRIESAQRHAVTAAASMPAAAAPQQASQSEGVQHRAARPASGQHPHATLEAAQAAEQKPQQQRGWRARAEVPELQALGRKPTRQIHRRPLPPGKGTTTAAGGAKFVRAPEGILKRVQ